MIDDILHFIEANTCISANGLPSGITSKELEYKYNNLILNTNSNSVPSLGSILARLVDLDEVITDSRHGKIIWLHIHKLEGV